MPISESPPAWDAPPGLRAQFGSTTGAAKRLAMAHLDLAKSEAKEIGGRAARAAALGGLAFVILLMAFTLLVVGTSLFVAEWLFGSMGWGVLHGLLLFTGIALAAVFAAIGLPARAIGLATLGGVIVAVAVSLVLAFELPNRLYTAIGDGLGPNLAIDLGVRPLVVGVVLGALIGLVLGIVLAVRGAGIAALLGLAVAGALVGAISAATLGPQVGVALGITAGYIAWIGLLAASMAATGVDGEALKARFYPTQTIETSKETLEWLKTRMPPAPGS